jgi:transposase InsO family protein
VHEQNFECYGYPRVWHELRRQGEQVDCDHVARLMRSEGIRGAKRRGKPWRTTIPDPEAHKRPDLVNRQFTADAPDRLWVGDLTYLRTWEGRMYFAFLIDMFSRMIVGWQLASRMRCDLLADELGQEPNDALLGQVAGVPFYIDTEQYERGGEPEFLLDVVSGAPEGFSSGSPTPTSVTLSLSAEACSLRAA